jgi:hypothetical protein
LYVTHAIQIEFRAIVIETEERPRDGLQGHATFIAVAGTLQETVERGEKFVG